jgi:hypothetical protein
MSTTITQVGSDSIFDSPGAHDRESKPGAPVTPLTLTPLPDEEATRTLLSLGSPAELDEKPPNYSPSMSPRGSPRRITANGPWFGDDVLPEAERGAGRRMLREQLQGLYKSAVDSGPAPARWEQDIQDKEAGAFASARGDSDQYWALLHQTVSLAVLAHLSPEPDASRRSISNSPDAGGSKALHPRSPSAVQNAQMSADETPNRAAKRRKGMPRGVSPKAHSVAWSDENDQSLKVFVQSIGTKWTLIGAKLNRTGKQCRERWCNHVDPDVSHEPWSDMEDQILLQAHTELGNQWVEVARRLPGRPYNAVKNRFNKASLREKFRPGSTSPNQEDSPRSSEQ